MKIQKITFMALTALLTLSLGACSLIGQKNSQKNQGGTENSSRESQKNTSSIIYAVSLLYINFLLK